MRRERLAGLDVLLIVGAYLLLVDTGSRFPSTERVTHMATNARVISRDEYDRKRRQGYAGPASELLPATREHIAAPFWMLSNEGARGTCLVGVEVAR